MKHYWNIILDYFCGSGSIRLIKLELKRCDAIVKQWEEFTGKEAGCEENYPLSTELVQIKEKGCYDAQVACPYVVIAQ